jgi:predicted TIM-barrel fold metal-dependent hydrolase
MDTAGIHASVLMPMDLGLTRDGEPPINIYEQNAAHARICSRHQERLYSFVGIDPRREGAAAFFRKGIEEWGMKGLKLYPPAGFYPFDPVCEPLYQRALEYGVPVLFHTGFAAPGLRAEYARPIYLDTVAHDFPDLKIVMGHTGYIQAGAWWHEAVGVATYKPNVHLELSTWQGWSTDQEFVGTLAYMRDRVGPERILWASDRTGVPLRVPQRDWVTAFEQLPQLGRRYGYSFSSEEVELILGRNAADLYRLPTPGLTRRTANATNPTS